MATARALGRPVAALSTALIVSLSGAPLPAAAGASGADGAAPGTLPAPGAAFAAARGVDRPGGSAVPAAGDTVPGGEVDPYAVLERAAARYDSVRGFCAEFDQERVVPLLNQTTRSRGTLCQLDPAYLLMDFSDPDGDRVISDGEHLWMYYPSVNPGQVIRTRLGGPGGRTFDFQREFLENATERFEATHRGRETVTGRPTHLLALRPKEEAPGYVEARVWIDAERGLVRKVEIEEENESVRRIVLSDIRVNPGLEPSRFRFEPPPDVRIIDRAAPGGSR